MDLLTVQETAAMLRLSPITIRRYIAAGRLPAVKIGRAVRVRREAVEGLLKPVVPPHLCDDPEDDLSIPEGRPFTFDDPLWDIVGMVDSGPDGATEADAALPRLADGDEAPAPGAHSLLRIAALARTDDLAGGPTDAASDKYAALADAYAIRKG